MSASSARQPASSSSSEEDRAAKRLAKYRRYNASSKGQARNVRYEAAHPERAVRWSPITGREVAAVAAAVADREVWPDVPPHD